MTISAKRHQVKNIIVPVVSVNVVNVVVRINHTAQLTSVTKYKQNYVFLFLKFLVIPSHDAGE